MSINSMKVWITCPSCGHTIEEFDYHENTSSDRSEYFVILSRQNGDFTCRECGEKTDFDALFRKGFCSVENKDAYKKIFASALDKLSSGEEAYFSDWDYDFFRTPRTTEQPALDHLSAMYPDDEDFAHFVQLFRGVRLFGRDYINKLETAAHTVSRNLVRWAPSLRKVYLHNGVGRIEAETFRNCSCLWDIFLPDSVEEIGDDAFSNSGLKTIRTSANLLRIGKRAFQNCRSLSKLFFPDHLREIGESCFENCTCLSELYIPDRIRIGQNAFRGCTNLKKIELPQSLNGYDASFFGLNDTVQMLWR